MSEAVALEGVTAGYGEARMLDDVTLSVQEGDSLALLGRNGVGKTTLLLTLVGLTRIHRGRVRFAGRDVTRISANRRVRAGLGWVPQNRGMWPSLTVEEHLTSVNRKGEWTLPKVYGMFPRLEERRRNYGNELSGGEQQMLAIGRALMTDPRVLLLDEPMEGLAPMIVQELTVVLRRLSAASGMTILLVEQHAKLALSVMRDAIVLDRGRIVHRSDCESLRGDDVRLSRLLAVSAARIRTSECSARNVLSLSRALAIAAHPCGHECVCRTSSRGHRERAVCDRRPDDCLLELTRVEAWFFVHECQPLSGCGNDGRTSCRPRRWRMAPPRRAFTRRHRNLQCSDAPADNECLLDVTRKQAYQLIGALCSARVSFIELGRLGHCTRELHRRHAKRVATHPEVIRRHA